MFTLDAFTHFVTGMKTIHRRQQTERVLRELPGHIRHDIGLEELPPVLRRGRR